MDHYLRIGYERPGLKLLDGLVPYMRYEGVPHAVMDGYVTLAGMDARRCAFFITPKTVNKGDLDAWILAANDRGSVGCLPEYRISLITQTDYSLDDEEEKEDGYEYLFCFYDPDWTKSIMGRFRTIDDWKTIREHLTTWTSGVAREHGERAFRIPGTVLKPPLWYPPYP